MHYEQEELLTAAQDMADGIKSFVKSLPFVAPEAIEFQVSEKLLSPLAEFEALVDGK